MTAREQAEADVKRQVLAAHHQSKPFTVHRAGIDIALKAIASIWADHPDYDPSWRSSRPLLPVSSDLGRQPSR